MIESAISTMKIKALLAVLSLLFLGGMYEMSGTPSEIQTTTQETKDPFVLDIQARSDLVYNAAMEAVNKQGVQQALTYKQTCESSIAFIRGERLDTENGYNTLDEAQKELIDNYRNYLDEAAIVVSTSATGEKADLTAMNEAKEKLY